MPKKGENIYKRKDGRWEGRYIKARTSTGKIVYGYVYSKTYRETKIKLKEKSSNINRFTQPQTQLFATIASEWFESIKAYTKISTQNKYYNLLTLYILPQYGKQTFDAITYEFIESYCRFLLKSGGKKDSKPIRVLNKIEQKQLCTYILQNPDPCNIGILVCLFTGLRIGEICALRWEDISLSEQTIYIHQTLQRIQNLSDNIPKTKIIITTPKSACSIRTIPLPDELYNILIKHQKPSRGYLLTNDDNKFIEPRTLQNRFKKILKDIHIADTNFHTLRHTFATRCIELGFDIKSLSEILGHATVNITMNRYVHPTLEMKKENMQKLSHFLAVK